jgi:octanoyl-[GcvH]:protein N-octanoyltransferase
VTTRRRVRLVRDAFPDRPAFDTALSRAVLLRVAEGEAPETFRLFRPGRILSFGRRDAREPGYPAAVRAARWRGFEAVQRLAGGRAAVFHEDTLAFAHAVPDHTPRARTAARFVEAGGVMQAALARLGIDARVGEVPGEYCPGAYSVSARGERKLVGVGQRLVAGAAHVGGVLVVAGADRIRDVLLPVYAALGLEWDPTTVGSIQDEAGHADLPAVADAVVAALADRHDLVDGRFDPATLELAGALEAEHLAADAPPPPRRVPAAGG